MTILKSSINELRKWRTACRGRVGFVPTMGALHEGHGELIKRSLAENEATVVSIFVNPTQFNNSEDLTTYPRNLDHDLETLSQLGADVAFAPSGKEMYPHGYRFKISEFEISQTLEGKSRPGHFEGMMTVVLKLLNIVSADSAYFGEKDFQQLLLVQELVKEFFIPTEIVACPTVREASGLALSSRNQRLSTGAKQLATKLSEEIRKPQELATARAKLESLGFEIDYLTDWMGRRLVAAQIEDVRLIDNVKKPTP